MKQRHLYAVPESGASPPETGGTNRHGGGSAYLALVIARQAGISILDTIHTEKKTLEDLVDDGFSKKAAYALLGAAKLFCGPTQFGKLRRKIRDIATDKRINLASLLSVYDQVKKLDSSDEKKKHDPVVVAHEILSTVDDGLDPEAAGHHAKSVVRGHNRAIRQAEEAQARAEGRELQDTPGTVFISDTTDVADKSQIIIENPNHVTSHIRARLTPAARVLMRKNTSLTFAQAMNIIVLHCLLNQEAQAGEDGVVLGPVVPMVIITIDEYGTLREGTGGEIEFAMTDGTVITGREILKRGLADKRFFAFHTKQGQPLNVYETTGEETSTGHTEADSGSINPFLVHSEKVEATIRPVPGKLDTGNARAANRKQRLIAEALAPVCPWPGCRTPANQCQVHHLVAHAAGGQTHPGNLSPACPPHNGRNDDTEKDLNGKLVMVDWEIHYQPAGSDTPLPNTNPILAKSSTALAKNQPPISLTQLI